MNELIGHTLKEAKEIAKRQLGLNRMGDARFMLLLEGSDLSLVEDKIVEMFNFEEEGEESLLDLEELISDPKSANVGVKKLHPPHAHLDEALVSKGDLPRKGDLYYYRSYLGKVVQGEVMSCICFAECLNPDGTWQTVSLQDLFLKKKGIPKEDSSLFAYYQDNSKLRFERDQLLQEIEELKKKKQTQD
jgi:hypothetical protein